MADYSLTTEFTKEDAVNYWKCKENRYESFTKIIFFAPPLIYLVIMLLFSQVHIYQPLCAAPNLWFNILYTILFFVINWLGVGVLIYGGYALLWFVPVSYLIDKWLTYQSERLKKKWKKENPNIPCPYPYAFTNCSEDCIKTIAKCLPYVLTFLSVLSVSGFVDVSIFPGVFFQNNINKFL